MLNKPNALILTPGRTMRDRLERAAQQCVHAGRGLGGLLTGTAFFMAQCWLNSRERVAFGRDVTGLVAASKAARAVTRDGTPCSREKATAASVI